MVHQNQDPSSPGRRRSSADGTPEADGPSPKRRKVKQHEDTDNTRSGKTVRRKTACQSCRLRKVKCDAVRPACGICVMSGSSCQYTDPLPEKLTLESATELLCGKIEQLQNSLDTLKNSESRSEPKANGNNQVEKVQWASNDPDRPLQYGPLHATEPSKDFLQIPPHRTTADAVLNWDIFENRYPPMTLVGILFEPDIEAQSDSSPNSQDSFIVPGGLIPPNEEQIPALVDRFLQNVHTKNPVLDAQELVRQARIVACNGLRWGPWTCLVLFAAALGSVAKSFDAAVTVAPSPSVEGGTTATWMPDTPNTTTELQQAESYFVLATRRLGGLKHTILGSQCYFFAGVYLMYTLRPVLSWQYFVQSSHLYQLSMKVRNGIAGNGTAVEEHLTPQAKLDASKQRRLEQSMYWSCFKSESEFRVELPLPQTEISTHHIEQMFPSPPSPVDMGKEQDIFDDDTEPPSAEARVASLRHNSSSASAHATELYDLRYHAKRLCNEEESWYYYLTEIALRRIGNRIINSFFGREPSAWLDIKPLLGIALEFDTQVSAWSAHLPAAMQHWETNYTIRAPAFGPFLEGAGDFVSRELSWATENRLLEMRSWLYQPFLYYFIHRYSTVMQDTRTNEGSDVPNVSRHVQPTREEFTSQVRFAEGLGIDDATVLYHFITAGIECNLKVLDVRSLRHRHHGLWYDLRSIVCASFILLAIVRAGLGAWIPGGTEALWGMCEPSNPHASVISGKIGHVMGELDYWTPESPGLRRHREVLEEMTRSVQAFWSADSNV